MTSDVNGVPEMPGWRDLIQGHINPIATCGLTAPTAPHLSKSRLLLSKSHDDDAVGLADAALRPRGQCVIGLVQNDAMDVFLLAQPTGQTVLVHTEEEKC